MYFWNFVCEMATLKISKVVNPGQKDQTSLRWVVMICFKLELDDQNYWITGNSVKCERIIILFDRVRIRDSRLMSGVPPPTLQRLQILKTNLPSTTIAIKPTHSCQRRMELYVRLSLCHHLRLSLPLNVKLAMKTIFISVIGIFHFSICIVF